MMSDRSVGLDAVRATFPFRGWAESGLEQYTAEACAAFSGVFDRLVDELVRMGPAAAEESKLAAFEKAVDALNLLSATDERLIETGEREELCDLFNRIADAAGLDPSKYGDGEGPASEWREW